MAWDDAPPSAQDLAPSGGWDSTPPTTEELKPPPNMAESAIHGIVNNIPMGPQAAAKIDSLLGTGHGGNYSENLADYNQKFKEGKEAHPAAYDIGAVTGAVAPLLVPGVSQALEAAPVLGNAALGAAGAISNEDLTKNPEEIAKNAIEGAGVGGALGAIGKGFNAAKSAFAPAANRIESNAIAGAFDLNSRGINRLAKGLENPEEITKAIGKHVEDVLPGDFIGITDTAGSKYGKLLSYHDLSSNLIGDVIDKAQAEHGGNLPEVDTAIKKLESAAKEHSAYSSEEEVQAKNFLNDSALRLKQLKDNGQLNFRNLYDVKKGIGRAYQGLKDVNIGADKAYAIISDTIDNVLDRTTIPESLRTHYEKAKDIFRLTSELLPSMKKGVSKEVAGVGGGLLSAGLGTAAAMGHTAAIPAYVGKTAAKLLAPDLAQNLAYKAMRGAKNIRNPLPFSPGQGLTQELIDYVNSKRRK